MKETLHTYKPQRKSHTDTQAHTHHNIMVVVKLLCNSTYIHATEVANKHFSGSGTCKQKSKIKMREQETWKGEREREREREKEREMYRGREREREREGI